MYNIVKQTNKQKPTDILPPHLLTPHYISASTMPRAKQGQQKVSCERRRERFVYLPDHLSVTVNCTAYRTVVLGRIIIGTVKIHLLKSKFPAS